MKTILIATCATALAACSSGGTVDVGASSKPLTNQQAMLPNVSAGSKTELLVTVREVDVHVADDAAAEQDKSNDQSADGWITVFTGARVLDLFDVAATERFLGSATVPAGRVTQVRLVLDGNVTLVVDGVAQTLRCPSCSESGLKIVTEGDVTVAPGGHLHLDLEFDLDASLTLDGGALILRPTVKLQQR